MNRSIQLGVVAIAAIGAAGWVRAQEMPQPHTAAHAGKTSELTQPGQSAFGALSEVVMLLQADPSTDWSKVDITRLRNHLVDMDEVVMRAEARIDEAGDYVRITYLGTGRTLEAIQRMIPAHGRMMDGYAGWKSSVELQSNGATWTISSNSARERTRIRALGAFGLLTLGSHHGPHHLAMARGQQLHSH